MLTHQSPTSSPLQDEASSTVAGITPRGFHVRLLRALKRQSQSSMFRVACLVALIALLAVAASRTPHAQRDRHAPVKIESVTARDTAQGGKVYVIDAATALRPQAWHDREGLHVVIYKGDAASNLGASLGVKQRRVGDSLELVLPASSAEGMTIKQRGSQLEITIPHRPPLRPNTILALSNTADPLAAARRPNRRPTRNVRAASVDAKTTAEAAMSVDAAAAPPIIPFEPPIETEAATRKPARQSKRGASPRAAPRIASSPTASELSSAPSTNFNRVDESPTFQPNAAYTPDTALKLAPNAKSKYVAPRSSSYESYAPGAWTNAAPSSLNQASNTQAINNQAGNTQPGSVQSNIASATPLQVEATTSAQASTASSFDLPPSPTPAQIARTDVAIESAVDEEAAAQSRQNLLLYCMAGGVLILCLVLFMVRRRRQARVVVQQQTQIAVHDFNHANRLDADLTATDEIAAIKDSRWLKRGKNKNLEANAAMTTATLANAASMRPEANALAPVEGLIASAPASAPLVTFGAFQIDQEVNRLLRGQPVRLDVLASRATEDRQALEACLLKNFRAVEADESFKKKVRATLEEYGFIARMSAALLLANEACDRVSSARTLGELQAPAALPFLLEALYDRDAVVRNEAVMSLGTLGTPSAIGALLDAARRNADIPSNLLRDALEKCSVASLDFEFDITGANADAHDNSLFTQHLTNGLQPLALIEPLPDALGEDDENFVEALARLSSQDTEVRVAAARSLAQYQVAPSVAALAQRATEDASSLVRAAAVSSLGMMDHESVFVPVLRCLIDESREVRAAAARSLSRFGFDRADAYVRIIQEAEPEIINKIAHALVDAGFAAQAIERLTSHDHHHAYEAFSLLSLVVKGGQLSVVLNAIENHVDLPIRLALVRFMRTSSNPQAVAELRALNECVELPEDLRRAIEAGHEDSSEVDNRAAASDAPHAMSEEVVTDATMPDTMPRTVADFNFETNAVEFPAHDAAHTGDVYAEAEGFAAFALINQVSTDESPVEVTTDADFQMFDHTVLNNNDMPNLTSLENTVLKDTSLNATVDTNRREPHQTDDTIIRAATGGVDFDLNSFGAENSSRSFSNFAVAPETTQTFDSLYAPLADDERETADTEKVKPQNYFMDHVTGFDAHGYADISLDEFGATGEAKDVKP